jgi:hypothetical protein
MIGLGVAMSTGVMTFAAAFSAFSSEIPWYAYVYSLSLK